ALMVALTVIVVAFRDAIPQLFLGDDSGGNAAGGRRAAPPLLLCARFFFTRRVQAIAARAFRGGNTTPAPLLFSAARCLLICASGLAFPGRLGAVGIWIGFSTAVATFAALLICRFHVLTLPEDRRGRTKEG